MRRPFLPRPLKKYKARIYQDFGKLDILVLGIFIGLAVLAWWLLPSLKIYYKLLIFASTVCMGFILTLTTKDEVKLYEKIFYFFLFLSAKKRYSQRNTKLLYPYKQIENDVVKLKNGQYLQIIELKGFDFFLLHEQEQQHRINAFQNFLLQSTQPFKIYKVNLPINLKDQVNYVENIQEKWTDDQKIKPIAKMSQAIMDTLIKRNTHVQDRYFLFLFDTAPTNLITRYQYLRNYLENAHLQPKIIQNPDEIKLILNSFYGQEAEITKVNEEDGNQKLNIQGKVTFGSRLIKTKNQYMKIFGLYALPKEAYLGWIASLGYIKGVNWVLDIANYPKDKARKKINKVINSLEERTNRKASQEAQTDTYLESMYDLNLKLNSEGESIKSIMAFVIVKTAKKKELEKLIKEVKSQAAANNLYLTGLMHLQKETFQQMLPLPQKRSRLLPSLEIQTLGLAYGFPFLDEDHQDKEGFYLGYSSAGRNIFFDPLMTDKNRSNFNMYIFGAPGKGKSTTVKKILKELFLAGHKIIVIDPEQEYDKLCQTLDGTIINFGTDYSNKEKNYVINPMQFLKNESNERQLLSSHVQFLEQFFKTLLPGINLKEINYLKRYILQAYANKGISDDNSYLKIKTEMFPLVSDVYDLICQAKEKEKELLIKDILSNLMIYLEPFTIKNSPEAKLWNQHTNFNLFAENFIDCDIRSLGESGNKRLINTQMFLLLKMANNFMVENQIQSKLNLSHKFLVIVIDEAHVLVDEEAPFATQFMYETVKRGRKYKAMTIVTTQSVKDFLGSSPNLLRLTSGIINACQYAFIFNMNAGDIDDLDNSMRKTGGLTEMEKETLATAGEGKTLFIVGNKNRKIMQIDVAEEELALWENKKVEPKGEKGGEKMVKKSQTKNIYVVRARLKEGKRYYYYGQSLDYHWAQTKAKKLVQSGKYGDVLIDQKQIKRAYHDPQKMKQLNSEQK